MCVTPSGQANSANNSVPPADSPAPNDDSFKTGVGVGIGAAAGAFVLAVVITLLFMRRRKGMRTQADRDNSWRAEGSSSQKDIERSGFPDSQEISPMCEPQAAPPIHEAAVSSKDPLDTGYQELDNRVGVYEAAGSTRQPVELSIRSARWS